MDINSGLFASFVQKSFNINPKCDMVRTQSEVTIIRNCALNEREINALQNTDFAYFVAIMASDADVALLIIVCKAGHWLSIFNEIFNDRNIGAGPIPTGQIVEALISPLITEQLNSKSQQVPRLIASHRNLICEMKAAAASIGTVGRYLTAVTDYCQALLRIQELRPTQTVPGGELESLRRRSIPASILFTLAELGLGIDLPDEIFENPAVQGIHKLATDTMLMINDHVRGISQSERPNIGAFQLPIMSTRYIFDCFSGLVEAQLLKIDVQIVCLPRWGEAGVDSALATHAQGIKNVVKAFFFWTFRTWSPKTEDD